MYYRMQTEDFANHRFVGPPPPSSSRFPVYLFCNLCSIPIRENCAVKKKKMYDDLVFSIGNVHFSSIKLIAIENCVRIMRPLWMNESPFDSDTSYVTSISGELQAADYFPERISR